MCLQFAGTHGRVRKLGLYGIFINDFCSLILFSKLHFYADDLQIYLSGDRKDLDEMISAHSEDLAAISQWSAKNGWLLNPRKLQAILISNSAVGMVLPSLFLGTEEITWCDSVTDLGVVIDGPFRFDRQVTKVCSRVDATLHRLRLLKFLTPKRVRLNLCKALLLQYFFYCDVGFSTYPHAGMNSWVCLFLIIMIFVFFRSFSIWYWRSDLVISLLTLLVRVLLELLTSRGFGVG
jgi:hypothetical protein